MNLILSDTQVYLDMTKEYHIVCHSGGRSSRACCILKEKDYNVVAVSGCTRRYRGRLEK